MDNNNKTRQNFSRHDNQVKKTGTFREQKNRNLNNTTGTYRGFHSETGTDRRANPGTGTDRRFNPGTGINRRPNPATGNTRRDSGNPYSRTAAETNRSNRDIYRSTNVTRLPVDLQDNDLQETPVRRRRTDTSDKRLADYTQNREKTTKSRGIFLDYSLLFITLFMVCFGLVIVYSASSYEAYMKFHNSRYYLNGQLRSVALGIFAMLIMIYKFNYNILKNKPVALLVYFGSVMLCLMVLSPLGVSANGARRWVNVGMSIQVCEVMKVGIIIFMAYYIEKYSRKLKNWNAFLIGMFFIGVPGLIIALITSDLSSAIVIVGIGFIMLYVASPKISHFIVMILVGIVAVGVLIKIQPYRMGRVKAWLNPAEAEDGYQVLQSLYSLGSGGLFGKGLGKGIQKLGYVPEAQNDMIFTVVCEELGIIGGIAVILMLMFMIWRFAVIAENANDLFGSMLVIGVMAHISVQSIINIAVVTNTMPNTGVTLPFLSCGGSSMMFLLIEIGIVLTVSKRIKERELIDGYENRGTKR